jgi:hypothetical protein
MGKQLIFVLKFIDFHLNLIGDNSLYDAESLVKSNHKRCRGK